MPAVSIGKVLNARQHPQRFVNNGMIVPIHAKVQPESKLNQVLRWHPKCLFRSPGKLTVPASTSASSRSRWRGAGHTSPMTNFLAVVMRLTLPGAAGAGSDIFGRCAITEVGGATTDVDFYYGNTTVTGDGNTPQHHSSALFLVPALPDTDYEWVFEDHGLGGGGGSISSRLVSGLIYELTLPGHTLNGYPTGTGGVFSPIYDSHRALTYALADAAFRQQGGLCAHFTTDVDTEAVTRTSSTPANFVDDSVTTLGAHPRFKIDLRAHNRRSQSGVPVVMKAYASMTGSGVGYVRLYDSAGDPVSGSSEVEVTGASPAWHEATFEIPAVEDEYAITIQGDDADEIEVFAVSLYELDEG